MKQLLIFLFCTTSYCAVAQVTVNALRAEYPVASKDSLLCASLYTKTKMITPSNNTLLAYKGAIAASYANHIKQRDKKLYTFKEGRTSLEQAISNDSSNVEIRFLRLTIQSNCPKVLGYNKQITNDKNFIKTHLTSVESQSLKNSITEFLNITSATKQ
jgi:hypothetical protein